MSSATKTEDDERRAATLAAVKEMLWKVYELEVSVRDFDTSNQSVVEERLANLLKSVKGLSSNTLAFQDLKIPVDLLMYLDEGGNPDQYTVDTFKSCIRDNQVVKGRVSAVNEFREQMMVELENKMPEETEEYKALLGKGK